MDTEQTQHYLKGYFSRIITGLVLSITFIYIATLFSCNNDIECQRVSANTTSESRSVAGFDGVIFNSIGDVYFSLGPSFSFNIQGPENVVSATTTNIEDGLLVIGTSECFNGNASVRIDITAPDINRLAMAGTGNIYINDTIKTEKLTLELYGIGDINAAVDVDSLFTDVVGNGNVNYKGFAISHELRCSGSLVQNSYDLHTQTTNILITGLGDCYVRASDDLYVTITGQGTVYYKGTPLIHSNITGSGAVIDRN